MAREEPGRRVRLYDVTVDGRPICVLEPAGRFEARFASDRGALAQIAQVIGRPELALVLVSGIGDIDSTGPSTRMWALSRSIRQSAALSALFDAGLQDLYERIKNTIMISGSDDPAQELAAFGASVTDWERYRGFERL